MLHGFSFQAQAYNDWIEKGLPVVTCLGGVFLLESKLRRAEDDLWETKYKLHQAADEDRYRIKEDIKEKQKRVSDRSE